MPSFWPFKSDDNSAASFEKTLSQLSQKITKASSRNDHFRQKQRRYKALWTLYTSFAYILVALILTLVTGWERWGSAEYTTVAGGPVLIYGVRTALDAYFNYRIANSQNSLDELQKQREATIERLKTATKYNSTQQLLDKYGGTPKKQQQPSPQVQGKRKSQGGSNQNTPQGGRTGFGPPPTANIPGRSPPSGPATPQNPALMPVQPSPEAVAPGEEFAPNAFPGPRMLPPVQQATTQYAADGPKWYDRLLDVVLGEDETQARNRIALICKNCRLVNGQAPPGTRSLEELGRWRCSSCQAWNGIESEEKRILQQISASGGGASLAVPASRNEAATASSAAGEPTLEDETSEYEEVDEAFFDDTEEPESTGEGAADVPPASSTRSKARQRK